MLSIHRNMYAHIVFDVESVGGGGVGGGVVVVVISSNLHFGGKS